MNARQEMTRTLKFTITGQVQGVGFRPFIYRLAQRFHLYGWVKNRSGEVIVVARGKQQQLEKFQHSIISQHPPLAIPNIESIEAVSDDVDNVFVIADSTASDNAQRHIPPDYFTCPDCLTEMDRPSERRYRYPFINCTQCGPRYTIIEDLPYDRPNTSMHDFPLCDACFKEYSNALDRRFHAQPLACPDCGPKLSYVTHEATITGNEATLKAAIDVLKQGKILALKGVGGYHLICDATNDQAVLQLRQRKHRPHKPLAVMFANSGLDGLEQVRRYCTLSTTEAEALSSPQRPIVLVKTKPGSDLADAINPGLDEIGAMLPYSPLHTLIANDFAAPLIATSGNLSGEPVLTDNDQAQARLDNITDAFVQHNRPILRPADDSVVRIIDNKKRLLRIGRGMAPLELTLPFSINSPVLATGGHMKNTIALAWENRVIVSPHIGELDSRRSTEVFTQVIADLCQLYRISPSQIVCDAHPDYYSSRFAKDYARHKQIPFTTIQHHKAHAGIVCGDFACSASSEEPNVAELPWLVFCWDGTGLGDDHSIWGGEGFYGHAGHWQRLTSIKPFYLQGGDKAAQQPWRSACALLWETEGQTQAVGNKATAKGFHNISSWQPPTAKASLAYKAWKKRINTIKTTSMGRLFDAASALLSMGDESSFEGQGPMQLEALLAEPLSQGNIASLPLYQENDVLLADWSDLLHTLLDPRQSPEQCAQYFHVSIAETLIAKAVHLRSKLGQFRIGLSGGVFQNKHLSEYILKRLADEQFSAYLPEQVPYNDAGLAFGQVIEAIYAQRD